MRASQWNRRKSALLSLYIVACPCWLLIFLVSVLYSLAYLHGMHACLSYDAFVQHTHIRVRAVATEIWRYLNLLLLLSLGYLHKNNLILKREAAPLTRSKSLTSMLFHYDLVYNKLWYDADILNGTDHDTSCPLTYYEPNFVLAVEILMTWLCSSDACIIIRIANNYDKTEEFKI